MPAYVVAEAAEAVAEAGQQLPFPLFVKPNTAGDSLGIDHDSLVYDTAALLRKAGALIEGYMVRPCLKPISLVESSPCSCTLTQTRGVLRLLPLEFRFPDGEHFKTYDLKVRSFTRNAMFPVLTQGSYNTYKQPLCTSFRDSTARAMRAWISACRQLTNCTSWR